MDDTHLAPQMLNRTSIVVAAKNQVSTTVQDEVVLLNLSNGLYYGLDPIGAEIWNLIQIPRQVADLCEVLIAEYEVDQQQCEQEVLALLGELAAVELIEVQHAPDSAI